MPDVILKDGASIEDTIQMLKKTLTWLMQNLDHDNVKRLYTEYCSIQSANGETQIDGPLIKMYDQQETPVLRIQMGYDISQNKFEFEIYDANGKKSVYLDDTGTEVLDGKLLITYLTKTLLHAYKDTNGGVFKIYDTDEKLNVKIGVESGTAANVGGTLILFLDSPYETSPESDAYQRVSFGIRSDYMAGGMNLKDNTAKNRVSATADSSLGPYVGVRNTTEVLQSYLTATEGYINFDLIATQAWVESLAYATKSYVDTNFSLKTHTHSGYVIGDLSLQVYGGYLEVWQGGSLVGKCLLT